jgi:hypothetical protein
LNERCDFMRRTPPFYLGWRGRRKDCTVSRPINPLTGEPLPYLRARLERQAADLNLKQASLLSGLTAAEISLIETGRLVPTQAQLEKLARVFPVSPASLLLKPVTVRDLDEQRAEPARAGVVRS